MIAESEAKKQELNCGVNTIPLLKYLENIFGYSKMCEITEPLGLPVSFLLNKRNWVSYDYYISLLEKMVEVTKDENAPFKMTFSLQPQYIFEELYYSTYSTIFLTPKIVYKFMFNEFIYTRYQKTADFKILSSTRNSLIVEFKMKKNYQQHIYNCKAIRGFLSIVPVQIGLPPANITHTNCAAEGKESCIYTVTWKETKKRSLFYLIFFIVFLSFLSSEIFIFKNIFSLKDILLSIAVYLIFFFTSKSFEYLTKIRKSEKFNINKNNSILESMEKIEHDYNEILETKLKLEERNKYLSIINEINTAITEAFHFDLLLNHVAKILLNVLNLNKAIYFQYNFHDKGFHSLFEISNNKGEQKITYPDLKLLYEEKMQILKHGNIFTINQDMDIKSKKFLNWLEIEKNPKCYSLSIGIPNTYSGFFVFLTDIFSISDELLNSLFENISSQLKVGYEKISSKYIIDNILSSIPSNVVIFSSDNYDIRYINDMFVRSFPDKLKEFSSSGVIGLSLFSIIPFTDNGKSNLISRLNKLLDDENFRNL